MIYQWITTISHNALHCRQVCTDWVQIPRKFLQQKTMSQNSCLSGLLSFLKAQEKNQTTTKTHNIRQKKPKNQQKPTKQKHHITKKTQQTTQNKTNHQTQQLCNVPSVTFLSVEATFCAEELEDCIFSIWNRKGITFLFNALTKSDITIGFSSTWNTSKVVKNFHWQLFKKLPTYSTVHFYPSSQPWDSKIVLNKW